MIGVALLLPASFTLADGEGPSRKMPGPEAAAFNALKREVQEALPKTPANYTLAFGDGSGPGGLTLPESIQPDQMARLQFSATYTLSQEYRDGQQRTLFTDRAKGTPEQQARLAALDVKELSVRFFVNQQADLNDKAVPCKLAGFPLAFEQTEECRDYGTSCISVFLGAFDKGKRVGGYTRYNLRNANLGVTTKPRGLVVVVAGPNEQAQGGRDFLSQVNLAKLKGLLP